jgi:hypothetical protein
MYPLKKSISLAFGLVLLATVAIVITTGTVGASPRMSSIAAAPPTPAIPVSVTNTPLPVNVVGTPTVNANIGTPNVNINGTPTVNVNSSATSPVYVDTDRPERNGFNASCNTDPVDSTYGQASCTLFTIPAGREVVIESVACTAFLTPGNVPGQADIIVANYSAGPFPSGQGVYFPIALSKTASSSLDQYEIMTNFRIYASSPPEGSVGVGIFYRTNYSASYPQALSCAVAGHMVP